MANELPLTLANLRLRVFRLLEDVDWIDSITDNILATPTGGTITVNVNDPTQWTNQTRWEVDSEQFLVTSGGANPVTLTRALEGSVAAAHTAGTLARRDPRHLTPTVNEAINVVVRDWCSAYFPQLVWDTTTGGTYQSTKWIVTAPADAYSVEKVELQFPGGYTRLQPVDHGQIETFPTNFASTGFGFRLFSYDWIPGYTIYVLYGKRWPFLSADTDTVPADFPEDGVDLIPTGAAMYIAGWRQIPKGRIEEITFAREAGTASQTNFSAQLLNLRATEWRDRARQVANRRPVRRPSKILMGPS